MADYVGEALSDAGLDDPSTNGAHASKLIIQRASEIPIEAIAWLWPGRIALGKLTLIAGEAGLGKSQTSLAMAAAVTTGGEWPCSEGRAPRGSVIVLSAEDGASDTVVPRLIAAGADCERVRLVTAVRDQRRRTFDLGTDLALLEKEIARVDDVRLILVDPISSYLGAKIDSHVNAAVRGVLEPVSELASRLGIAIVAITHPPKGTGTTAINRFIGSIAFVAAARAAFMVTRDADDPTRRLFLPVKNNLAAVGNGLAFRLEQRIVGEPREGIVASSVAWESEAVRMTADQALQATDAQGTGKGSAGGEAEELLRNALATGPVAMKDIQAEAKEAGLSWATVRRAKERLGIVAERESHGRDGGGRWTWAMPIPARCSPHLQDAHPFGVSALQRNEHLAALDQARAPVATAPADDHAHPSIERPARPATAGTLTPRDGIEARTAIAAPRKA
jgi:putative DNA primase/helicase